MNMTMIPMNESKDFLIVALDFNRGDQALEIVHKLPKVNFYKVGMELFYSEGPPILEKIKSLGKKIFLDLKMNDIPKTMEKTVRKLSSFNVDYLTVFCDAGGIKAAREGAVGSNLKILNVTVLTSAATAVEDVTQRAQLSLDSGADGIICSGQETKALRSLIKEENFIIVNPGIRLVETRDDQVRTVTPRQAWDAGATNIVVGRPITLDPHPEQVAENIFNSLSNP